MSRLVFLRSTCVNLQFEKFVFSRLHPLNLILVNNEPEKSLFVKFIPARFELLRDIFWEFEDIIKLKLVFSVGCGVVGSSSYHTHFFLFKILEKLMGQDKQN